MSSEQFQIGFAVTGAGAAAAETDKVAGALKNVGVAAQNASAGTKGGGILGGLTQGMAGFATQASGFFAAAKLIRDGLGEIAEDDGAALALQKYTLSVEEAAAASEMLDGLRAYGGDKVGSAEIFGKVMSGQTRILKQFGIEMAEGASRQERFTALQALAARGAEVQKAKLETLGGQFWALGEATGDATGKLIKFAVDGLDKLAGGEGGADSFLNKLTFAIENFGKGNAQMTAEAVKAAQAGNAQHAAQKAVNRAAVEGAKDMKIAEQALADYTAQVLAAVKAVESLTIVQAANDTAEKARAAAKLKKDDAGVDAAVRDGAMTEEEGARQKETNAANAEVATATAELASVQKKGVLLADMMRKIAEENGKLEQAMAALPDGADKSEFAKAAEANNALATKNAEEQITNAAAVSAAESALEGAKADRAGLGARQSVAMKKEAADAAAKAAAAKDKAAAAAAADAADAAKAAQESEEENSEIAGKFTKEFGSGANRQRAIADARKRSSRPGGGSFEDELGKNVKTDRLGRRRFSEADKRSDADRLGDEGSALDRFNRETAAQKGEGGETGSAASADALKNTASDAQKTATMLAGLAGTLGAAFQAQQAAIDAIKAQVEAVKSQQRGSS